MKHGFRLIDLSKRTVCGAHAALLSLILFSSVPCAHAMVASAVLTQQVDGRESTPEAQSPEKNKQEQDSNEAYKHSAIVKALGAKLGMTTDQAATAFEVTNFLVLAVLVGWFLAKALPKVFRDRTGIIQRRLVEARAATEEASARLNSVEGRLAKLDEQIAEMKGQAEHDLAAEEIRVRTAIDDERKKILAAAEQEIGAATAQARRQIQQYAAELAIEQAAKKLVVSAETDRVLVREFAHRLIGKSGEQN